MEQVSRTAQWIAAARAVESSRGSERLFVDDMAHELAKPDGYELLDRYGGGGLVDFIAIRTKYFDDRMRAIREELGIAQIVLVAAGMDTRAYRLRWPEGTSFYELDHAALLTEKSRRLATLGAIPSVHRIEVPADLAEPWCHLLLGRGFDSAKPTLWLAESLLFYLSATQVSGLLSTLRALSAPGSRLLTDLPNEVLLASPLTQSFLSSLRADGVPWLFGSDDPASLLREHGWECRELKEPGEEGAGKEHWKYRVLPRHINGVPRTWLIDAEAA